MQVPVRINWYGAHGSWWAASPGELSWNLGTQHSLYKGKLYVHLCICTNQPFFFWNAILSFSAEQMHIMSMEIEVLKNQVGCTDNFIPLLGISVFMYKDEQVIFTVTFFSLFGRKAYWRLPMIYFKKGYFNSSNSYHFKENALFERMRLHFDFRIEFMISVVIYDLSRVGI